MTEHEGNQLKVRLLRRCKYEPTIADIMEEWKGMKRQGETSPVSRETNRTYNSRVAAVLKATKQALRDGTYHWEPVITPVLVAFARHWIPDITEEEIKENFTEIEQAQRAMKDDYAQQRAYVTGLIRHGGMIVTCMKRVS